MILKIYTAMILKIYTVSSKTTPMFELPKFYFLQVAVANVLLQKMVLASATTTDSFNSSSLSLKIKLGNIHLTLLL